MTTRHNRDKVKSGELRHPWAGDGGRWGLTAPEVIVLLVLLACVVMVVLMLLPRGREHARMAACERNLAHVGFALAQYDQIKLRLPATEAIAGVDAPREGRPRSVLRTLLETLEQPDFLGVNDPQTRPKPRPGEVPGEIPVPGFVCGSDPNARTARFAAPISYRACTGDAPGAGEGAFAAGKTLSLKDIQERDGASFTAAFSERMVGDNNSEHAAAFNYMISQGVLPLTGCPAAAPATVWRGDAGSSWVASDYQSTLYNHSLRPGGEPSCIAGGGQEAFMGASSGHVPGVNVLYMDGRVTTVRPTIDPKIWKEFARIRAAEADAD